MRVLFLGALLFIVFPGRASIVSMTNELTSDCKNLLNDVLSTSPDTKGPQIILHPSYDLGNRVIKLSFAPFAISPSLALVLQRGRSGSVVAYGFEPSNELLLPLPNNEQFAVAPDVFVLSVSDAGTNTLKSLSDLCEVDTLSVHADSNLFQAMQETDSGKLTISFPVPGSRLLLQESHTLTFTLRSATMLSIVVNGTVVRKPEFHDLGEYETAIDFLGSPGVATFSLLACIEGSDGILSLCENVAVVVTVVDEPPSVLFQFPPPNYVYTSPTQVNIAILITYMGFLRYPSLEGGRILLSFDWTLTHESEITKDGEGVCELHVVVGPPFNEEGDHHLAIRLVDSTGTHLPVSIQTTYSISTGGEEIFETDTNQGQFALEEWAAEESKTAHQAAEKTCNTNEDCGIGGLCHESGLVCLCTGDDIGDWCNVSLVSNTEYLPPRPPHLHPARSAIAAWFYQDSRTLLHWLQSTHSPQACAPEKAFLFHYNDQGLAAQVSDASVQVSFALSMGRAAVFRGDWTYGMHQGCEHATGVACHFHPHLICDKMESLDQAYQDTQIDPRGVVAKAYSHKGSFWWYAQITNYLLQPNADFLNKLRSAMAAIGFEHPIIGVHVRNGDYCTHQNNQGGHCLMYRHCVCHGFDVYSERIKQMRDLYGVKTVFLATQDKRIVHAARADQGIRVLSLSFDRDQLTGSAARKALHWRQKLGYVDNVMVSESALLDLFILAECDYFVGSFHSQYSRLAYQLMAIRKGTHPPFASVFKAWGETLAFPL